MRSALALVVVLASGIAALLTATDGLRVFTAEGARRLAVAEAPRPLPDVLLEDAQGEQFRLSALQGRLLAVDFIYTRCATFCVVLGGTMQRLQAVLDPSRLGRDIVLLSISFDPRDTPERLAQYAGRFGAGEAWHLVRPVDPAQLPAVLQAFGITVIPDGFGGFEHNAAIHIVDRDGRLARIVDFDNPAAAATTLETLL